MDPACSFPHTDTDQILAIVRRLAVLTPTQAVDELLALPPVRHYVEQYSPEQINAFATHASRYFGLYHPSSCIEIAHTSRYSHRTGKSELCILATRILSPGTMNKDYLFLGRPASSMLIQHDCDNNCELSREGKHITFRGNRHCLCSSCEKAGRGGYAPIILRATHR
ncbi:hypothetical protein B0H13DRAFT_2245142 [Mycena leptocephala]|nr:hypothetical protein B0H13DRAFT_2245142 [Mycena leptocephala]